MSSAPTPSKAKPSPQVVKDAVPQTRDEDQERPDRRVEVQRVREAQRERRHDHTLVAVLGLLSLFVLFATVCAGHGSTSTGSSATGKRSSAASIPDAAQQQRWKRAKRSVDAVGTEGEGADGGNDVSVATGSSQTAVVVADEECTAETRDKDGSAQVKAQYTGAEFHTLGCVSDAEWRAMYDEPPMEFEDWMYTWCYAVWGRDKFYPFVRYTGDRERWTRKWCAHNLAYHTRAIAALQGWDAKPLSCGGFPDCHRMNERTKEHIKNKRRTWSANLITPEIKLDDDEEEEEASEEEEEE